MTQKLSPLNNCILAALSEKEYQRLEPYLVTVSIPAGEVLYQSSDKIGTFYFPTTGLISLVAFLENGTTSETGIVGYTGTVGLEVILGSGLSFNQTVVQVEGEFCKVSAQIISGEFDRHEHLYKLLLGCTEERLEELAQLSTCNRYHSIEERLARWLLMVGDLLQSEHIPLTQEFLSTMLGVRRSGVTLTAGAFQRSGIITYARGMITILDRESLENTACECYQLFHRHYFQQ